ncbi:hypothetical protein OG885_01580 [Streptomyces sp. NBC_00028]
MMGTTLGGGSDAVRNPTRGPGGGIALVRGRCASLAAAAEEAL